MKRTELTSRQAEALEIIRRHIQARGVPPSRSELAAEMGMTTPSGVDKHLIALSKKGWAAIHASVERGIQLLREGAPLLEENDIPTMRRTGKPALTEERREPKRLNDLESFVEHFDARPDYFLRVRGDWLDKIGQIGQVGQVGLRGGDLVAVQSTAHAHVREGDLVVEKTGKEVTLKRYHRKSKPEQRDSPIDAHTEDAEIVGVVVGAIVRTRQRPRQQERRVRRDDDLGM